MELTAVQRIGVAEGVIDRAAEIVLPARQRSEAALAGIPVARREVEERLGQPVIVEPGRNLRRRREIVGKQILDRLKACAPRRLETVEKFELLEEETEVGGEFRHGSSGARLAPAPAQARARSSPVRCLRARST